VPIQTALINANNEIAELRRNIRTLKVPRELTQDQTSIIAQRVKRWASQVSEADQERFQFNTFASLKAIDAKGYANQIRLAVTKGGLWCERTYDLGWGNEFDDRPEFIKQNETFLELHDANVTVCGVERFTYAGESLQTAILEALQLAGLSVDARPDIKNFGLVTIVVGSGLGGIKS
jgi:hypothetical protein